MLYYNTVNDLLRESLGQLMDSEVFSDFRLVGGTALSLQIGHRESIDIDLFSDAAYGTIDFKVIDTYLESNFAYIDHLSNIDPGLGKAYFIGHDSDHALKLDVYYTDEYIQPEYTEDRIRMATIEEIIAMKLDVIQRGGRKKDFWDLHELFNTYNIEHMLQLHKQRYPYGHDSALILQNFIDFSQADHDFDPICYMGKHWEFIKEDIVDVIHAYNI
ncbi:nucleotidyl transferase AbiEii/AbiGii toxin family protein [uncultured Algibacter sp.]|uniref:nucleotidyl transferase AbiEii/AbiGii toxin family protein n=1 Tax=uncultured Algibacter sp. TaxID=298659 RepID=UPI0026020EAE|nr:nucleotidyl transferase AbiEii/AbiGii toxin family protein [uncultured Algibacter sp.]